MGYPAPVTPAPDEPDAEALWQVLVDAVVLGDDSERIARDDWVQVRTPSSPLLNVNKILRARLAPDEADRRIAEVLAEHRARGASFSWIVDAGSRPADLGERLVRAGMRPIGPAFGMVRAVPPADFELPPPPPGVQLERAIAGDEERLAELGARGWGEPAYVPAIRAVARRVFAGECADIHYWLAQLDGELVGSATLRMMPGLGYMQGACVVPEARGRGIYKALLWARLAFLRARGVTHAVIWARERTSAPIAARMGFRAVTTAHFFDHVP